MIKRNSYSFSIDDVEQFKKEALSFFHEEDYLFYLDSNQSQEHHAQYSCLIGVGCLKRLFCKTGNAFDQLEGFREKYRDWMFGFLGYDLKNELEDLTSKHTDHKNFPDLCFIIPEHVMVFFENRVEVKTFASQFRATSIFNEIKESKTNTLRTSNTAFKAQIKAGDSKAAYLKKAQQFLDHIQRGDIYEANFCTQFSATNVELDSLQAFIDLNDISEPPFATYVKCGEYCVISASPERYLKKTANTLISQPIKGTARRSQNSVEDETLKKDLFLDTKERSENVMIVDLVRNDLSKIATRGTVKVEELYGIYSFKQVHHMISTITAQLDKKFTGVDALRSTFPMGSMTGAPKVSAMKIIEKTENFKRGLYSGAIGYFDPKGDFDFNVVIRTILFNKQTKNLSFAVGSAITIAANPVREYDECLLKAKALFEVLERQGIRFDSPEVLNDQ